MNEEFEGQVSIDPYNGDWIISQPNKDNIRVERWVWTIIAHQVESGRADFWKP